MVEEKLIMSQRDINRMHVVRLTLEGRAKVGRAAELLGLSTRQVKRLRKKMRERGAEGNSETKAVTSRVARGSRDAPPNFPLDGFRRTQ